MHFVWYDYIPGKMNYIETWLDEGTVKSTGLDEGFQTFYEYWVKEDGFVVGENFWCKVVLENDEPFAVIAFCQYEHKIVIMEVLVAPDKRGQGKGSTILKELLNGEKIVGFPIHFCEAIIYPDNIASKKAFEKAGFLYCSNHKDENGDSMYYVYVRKSVRTI